MKKTKLNQNIVAGVLGFILAVAYFFSCNTVKVSILMKSEYGPVFMPRIYAVLLAVLSIALLISGIKKAKSDEEKQESEPVSRHGKITVAISCAMMAVYILLVKYAGFLVATLIYMFAQSWLLAKKKNYLQLTLFAVIGSVAIWLLFTKLIGVILPKGPWGF